MARRSTTVLALLACLAVAGAWNYRRNLRLEAAEFRPYRSYAMADLEALIEAYEGEIAGARERYRAARGRAVRVRERQLLGEQIRELERVQQIARERRRLAAQVVEREAALARLTREREHRRAEEGRALLLFLRRLLTWRG